MLKRAIAVAFATAVLVPIFSVQASACQGTNLAPSRQSADGARQAITCLINRSRHKHGLRRLRASAPLATAAQQHSDAMASQNFFSHEGDGTPASRAQGAGYAVGASAWGLGENLEWASGKAASPRGIVRGWMRSAEHRTVMFTRRFRQVGIGVSYGSPLSPDVANAAIFTADFGFQKG
jgi:uncharacterized protein YkwD